MGRKNERAGWQGEQRDEGKGIGGQLRSRKLTLLVLVPSPQGDEKICLPAKGEPSGPVIMTSKYLRFSS